MVRELSENEVGALHYELLLKDIIRTADKLPPFPDVAWKVMALIRKTAPVTEISSVIKLDPAITARVLTLSQSTYYGRRSRVTSIEDAILLLGGQKLVQVILAACASRYFHGKVSGLVVSERALWNHSVATAVMGEKIARDLQNRKLLTIYTGALLHDIGKTVLDAYAKIYLHSSLEQIRMDEFIEDERRALGIDHQELGEIIAKRWRLPPEVIAAIGFHHQPTKATEHKDIVYIVYAANQMVSGMYGEKPFNDDFDPESDPVFIKLGIDAKRMQALQEELAGAMDEINRFLKNS